MHPLLQLIATRPQLLAEHAQAYGALAGTELARVSSHWKRQIVLATVALSCLAITAVLVGVALMLWATTPVAQMSLPWLLWFTPLPTALVALGCLVALLTGEQAAAFEEIQRQIHADMAMLREAGAA